MPIPRTQATHTVHQKGLGARWSCQPRCHVNRHNCFSFLYSVLNLYNIVNARFEFMEGPDHLRYFCSRLTPQPQSSHRDPHLWGQLQSTWRCCPRPTRLLHPLRNHIPPHHRPCHLLVKLKIKNSLPRYENITVRLGAYFECWCYSQLRVNR